MPSFFTDISQNTASSLSFSSVDTHSIDVVPVMSQPASKIGKPSGSTSILPHGRGNISLNNDINTRSLTIKSPIVSAPSPVPGPNSSVTNNNNSNRLSRHEQLAIQVTLSVNCFLTLLKSIAFLRSWSMSVLASLVDSLVDLVAQAVLLYANRQKALPPSPLYPAGRSRIEPVGVIVASAIMFMCGLEVIRESIKKLESGQVTVNMSLTSNIILGLVVIIKIGLWKSAAKIAKKTGSSAVEAISMDNRNDILSNLGAIFFANLGSNYVVEYGPSFLEQAAWVIDPIGAILISIFILRSWTLLGLEQAEVLIGKVCVDEEFLEEVRKLAEQVALEVSEVPYGERENHKRNLGNTGSNTGTSSSNLNIQNQINQNHIQSEGPASTAVSTSDVTNLTNVTTNDKILNFNYKMHPVPDKLVAYHCGPKLLVELEMIMLEDTPLRESHDAGIKLQHQVEALPQVERCFVHIDYCSRALDGVDDHNPAVPLSLKTYRDKPNFKESSEDHLGLLDGENL